MHQLPKFRLPKRYDIDFVLNNFTYIEDTTLPTEKKGGRKYKALIDGLWVNGGSHRYKTFKNKGIVCVCCGRIGEYFTLDKFLEDSPYHFNLYGTNKDGEELLFTKDHILPKSKGGKDVLENYQTMCTECNLKKKNNFTQLDEFRLWLNKYGTEYVEESTELDYIIKMKADNRFSDKYLCFYFDKEFETLIQKRIEHE